MCAQSELVSSSEAREEQCLCTQSSSREEDKIEKPFKVSKLTKLRKDNTVVCGQGV
jgi:hypothetical protein